MTLAGALLRTIQCLAAIRQRGYIVESRLHRPYEALRWKRATPLESLNSRIPATT